MKILDVSERVVFPPVDGATTRICTLLTHLSRRHDVRQLSLARLEHVRSRPFVREVAVTPRYLEHRYFHLLPALAWEVQTRTALREPLLGWAGLRLCRPRLLRHLLEWADVVLVEYPWQLACCDRLRRRAPVVLVAHNVEALNRASYARAAGVPVDGSFWFRKLAGLEGKAVALADLVVAVSAADRAALVTRYRADPRRVVVVPNGADTERYRPIGAERRRALKRELGLPDGPIAIYLAGGKNASRAAGLMWVRRVAELLPQVTFVVTGTLFDRPARDRNVIGTSRVDDPLPYLQAADLSLCPVEFGGGTKIKLLEALSVGLPTVAFADALAGLAVRHGEHVWVAEKSAQSLASAVERVLRDAVLARRLARAGREHVVAHHDWADAAAALEEALLRLVSARGSTLLTGSAPSVARTRPDATVSSP